MLSAANEDFRLLNFPLQKEISRQLRFYAESRDATFSALVGRPRRFETEVGGGSENDLAFKVVFASSHAVTSERRKRNNRPILIACGRSPPVE